MPDRGNPEPGVLRLPGDPTVVFLTVRSESGRWLAEAAVHEALQESWSLAHGWLVGDYLLMPSSSSPGAPYASMDDVTGDGRSELGATDDSWGWQSIASSALTPGRPAAAGRRSGAGYRCSVGGVSSMMMRGTSLKASVELGWV